MAEYTGGVNDCEDGLSIFHFVNDFAQVTLPIHVYLGDHSVMSMVRNLVTNNMSSMMTPGWSSYPKLYQQGGDQTLAYPY